MKTDAEPIKISLAAARVNARKTQAQLADEMDISRMTLANMENGKKQISKAQLHLFCELCHIPVANIFLPYKFSEWKPTTERSEKDWKERIQVCYTQLWTIHRRESQDIYTGGISYKENESIWH